MADDKNEVTPLKTKKKEDSTGKGGSTKLFYGFCERKVDEWVYYR